MPTLPLSVQPGDVISSELMTLILSRLSDLSDVVLTGTQIVPDVIGTQLSSAITVIQQPSRQLSQGFVIDITGITLNPSSSENATLIVLNQSPPAGSLVPINSPINLIVSRAADSTPDPGPQPTISGTETIDGVSATDFAVGGTMVLVGTNFSASAGQNVVTFDNTSAIVRNDPADPTRRLFVTVPTGIPGAPVNPGDPDKSNVVVSIRNTVSNHSARTSINVTAPVEDSPTISDVSPSTQFEGENITVSGTNFTGASQVMIRDVQATIVSAGSGEIVASVPQFEDIPANTIAPASVVVTIPGLGSVPYTGSFFVRGIN